MVCGTIETERLVIRPFSDEHLTDAYLSWLTDAELMRFSEQRHREHSMETCRAYMESFVGTSHCYWAIEATGLGGLHIGNVNAYVDVNNNVADVGILVGHAEGRKRGYGAEAWKGVLGYLIEERGVRKVSAGMLSGNTAMLRIAQKAGMVPDGVRKKHYQIDGEEMDVVHMAVFAEDWKR